MYNNILVFIVGGETSSRSEMHIFQVSCVIYYTSLIDWRMTSCVYHFYKRFMIQPFTILSGALVALSQILLFLSRNLINSFTVLSCHNFRYLILVPKYISNSLSRRLETAQKWKIDSEISWTTTIVFLKAIVTNGSIVATEFSENIDCQIRTGFGRHRLWTRRIEWRNFFDVERKVRTWRDSLESLLRRHWKVYRTITTCCSGKSRAWTSS